MSFSADIKDRVLVATGRCCAICHKFAGNNIELHHIKHRADGGEDTFENAIPLCFDCHAEVGQYDPKHPKGTKYSENELRLHRDAWYEKVQNSSGLVSSETTKQVDINTYNKLKSYIPLNLISYIKEINFDGGYFKLGELTPLEQFIIECENPFCEFLDQDLEIYKRQLCISICKFFKDSHSCIFCDDGIICKIPSDWLIRLPDKYEEYVNLLNEDTIKIWEDYYNYISICRRKLQIPE